MKLNSRDILFKAASDGPIENWNISPRRKFEIQTYILNMQKYLDYGGHVTFKDSGVQWTFQSALNAVILTKSFPPIFCSCINKNPVNEENFDILIKEMHLHEYLYGRCENIDDKHFYKQ